MDGFGVNQDLGQLNLLGVPQIDTAPRWRLRFSQDWLVRGVSFWAVSPFGYRRSIPWLVVDSWTCW